MIKNKLTCNCDIVYMILDGDLGLLYLYLSNIELYLIILIILCSLLFICDSFIVWGNISILSICISSYLVLIDSSFGFWLCVLILYMLYNNILIILNIVLSWWCDMGINLYLNWLIIIELLSIMIYSVLSKSIWLKSYGILSISLSICLLFVYINV